MITSVFIALGFVALTTLADVLGAWFVIYKFNKPKVIRILTHFAVGTLLSIAFLDLLPEALESGSEEIIFLMLLGGIIGFYVLENFIGGSHHEDDSMYEKQHKKYSARSTVVFVGATIEEFVDGVVIGLAVVIGQGSLALVIATSIAVFAHEFPDSVSRAVAFIKAGESSDKAMQKVLFTTLGSFFGAALAVILASLFTSLLPYFATLGAAAFIYIATAHLIPELHHKTERNFFFLEILAMIIGVVLVILIGSLE